MIQIHRNLQLTRYEHQLCDYVTAHFDCQVRTIRFGDICKSSYKPGSITISCVELGEHCGSSLDGSELESLKVILTSASILLWLSGGALFEGGSPESMIIPGLARAVMVEQPSLRFCFINVASREEELQALLPNACWALDRIMEHPMPDTEYLQFEGVLHISRFVPERHLSTQFMAVQNKQRSSVALKDTGRSQLSIEHLGQLDTLHFVEQDSDIHDLKPDWVDVEVVNYSLNAKVSLQLDKLGYLLSSTIHRIYLFCMVRSIPRKRPLLLSFVVE